MANDTNRNDDEKLGGQDGATGGDHKPGKRDTGPAQEVREQPGSGEPDRPAQN